MYCPRFTFKKAESSFKKNGLLLKTFMELKTFSCMWKLDWEMNCQLAYYQVKWSEEFRPDYCPYEVVYMYLPSCLRNSEYFSMCC